MSEPVVPDLSICIADSQELGRFDELNPGAALIRSSPASRASRFAHSSAKRFAAALADSASMTAWSGLAGRRSASGTAVG